MIGMSCCCWYKRFALFVSNKAGLIGTPLNLLASLTGGSKFSLEPLRLLFLVRACKTNGETITLDISFSINKCA